MRQGSVPCLMFGVGCRMFDVFPPAVSLAKTAMGDIRRSHGRGVNPPPTASPPSGTAPFPDQQPETVEHDNHGAALVPHHADRQRNAAEQGEPDQHGDGAEREDEILLNNTARALAQFKSREKILQNLVLS